ncbi:hypothetical protein HYU17_01690 [Candidatus Woesearchaeota archaeon]|nr:hypothetical protein [Candidatus Woesearchaeota archaeon]
MVIVALFGFGKKNVPGPQGPRVPVDEVVRMKRQGLTTNQIVQALQRNGYQTSQIFDALSQSDMRAPSPVQGAPGMQGVQQVQPGSLGNPPGMPQPPFDEGLEREASIEGPQNPDEMGSLGEMPGMGTRGGMPQGSEGFGMMGAPLQAGTGAGYGGEGDISAKVEEISEAIIEEKWQDLMKDFNKVVEWKGSVEQRMAALEQRFSDLKTAFDTLQKGVVEKVSDYDKSVKDVASEMKALEQVFQKIIPTLTENVNELSRITKGMKAPLKKQASSQQ